VPPKAEPDLVKRSRRTVTIRTFEAREYDGSRMAKPLHDQIVEVATKILANEPQGIRSTPLIRTHIRNGIPDLTLGDSAIHQVLLKYARQPDAVIYQPGRGIFRHTRFRDTAEASPVVSLPLAVEKIAEEMFYQPFAEWLVADLEECTKAKPVGGNKLKDKWGTPDVIGVRKPSVGDVIPAPIEIVSAEIKVSTDGLITAFGQACAYKLFSHRSYIVVPKTASPEDISRLGSLCLVVGIGLILLDPHSSQDPEFQIRNRAARHEPDTFYVNEKLRHVLKELLD